MYDNLNGSDDSPTPDRSLACTSTSETKPPANPTPPTQPEQVSDAGEASTDAAQGSTQQSGEATSQAAAPAPHAASTSSAPATQAGSTANVPRYLAHTLRDQRNRRHEDTQMFPELIDARVLSILNSLTPENSVERFCRSLSHSLAKVPEERQERVRTAILTLIAACQGEQEPNHVLGPIEQWRAGQLPIQMSSDTNIRDVPNVETLSSRAEPITATQQAESMAASIPLPPAPSSRQHYGPMSGPCSGPPAPSSSQYYGPMFGPYSSPPGTSSSQYYGQMSGRYSGPPAPASSHYYGQMSSPYSGPPAPASRQCYGQMAGHASGSLAPASRHSSQKRSCSFLVPTSHASRHHYVQGSAPTSTYSLTISKRAFHHLCG
ncbi:uncharacterized protein [Dendrobates tinctorius]|uniref:uncharacterized protein n=1 Tax=Dendrobates tinctorius TaxID=92724 RepID=UPI003CC96E8F